MNQHSFGSRFVNRVGSALIFLALAACLWIVSPNPQAPNSPELPQRSAGQYNAAVGQSHLVDTGDVAGNQNAIQRVENNPDHFKCLGDINYDKLTPENAIPTANVVATIAFDTQTGGYAVISVNPKIVISHREDHRPNGATGGTFVYDMYSWTFTSDSVKPYMVFGKNVDKDGNVSWSATPQRKIDGAYRLELRRKPHIRGSFYFN